jgi:type IV pilus assembly protein PilE
MNMKKNNRGFTLLELMIVVILIGIIAALAVPRFMNTSARSKQSEAQGILKQVYTLERTYFQEHGMYTDDMTALGMELMDHRWYQYTIVANGTTFTATATSPDPGIDDDPTPDIWSIDGDGVIVCVSDDVHN